MSRLYAELCRHFPRGRVEVCTVSEPDAAAWDAAYPVPVHRLPITFKGSRTFGAALRQYAWTRKRLRRAPFDVLQVGNLRPTGYAAYALRRRVPYVLYVHGLDLWKEEQRARASRRVGWTSRAVFGGASAIIANSSPIARLATEVMREMGVEVQPPVHVVHPGTDPHRFRPDAAARSMWRAELQAGDRPVLLSVCRLVRRKGIDRVLEAMPRLRARYPDLLYVVAGTGKDAPRLHALASELDLQSSVRFLGEVGEARLPGLYAAADVFVLPAREERERNEIEGFGIVYCEAAACGVPVVAGASGGVEDAVRPDETALLVPPEDVGAIAAAIDTLLADPALRARMGNAGRRSVETYYNWERAAADAWRILERVAEP